MLNAFSFPVVFIFAQIKAIVEPRQNYPQGGRGKAYNSPSSLYSIDKNHETASLFSFLHIMSLVRLSLQNI